MVPGCLSGWVFERMDVCWVFGCLGVWLSGCLGIWVYGSLAVALLEVVFQQSFMKLFDPP